MVGYTYVYHASPESGIFRFKPTGHHGGYQQVRMNRGGLYVAPKFSDAVAWATSYVAHKKGKNHPTSADPIFFRNITIYKIRIPKKILFYSWKSSDWEKEFFISDDDLDSLKITSRKTYSFHDLIRVCQKENRKKWDCSRSRWDVATAHARTHNLAAKYYLQLKDELNTLRLSGWDGNVQAVTELISGLANFLWDVPWRVGIDAKPKDVLTAEEVVEVEKIVAKVREVLENGRKQRAEHGSNRCRSA